MPILSVGTGDKLYITAGGADEIIGVVQYLESKSRLFGWRMIRILQYNGISHYKQSVFRRDIQFIDKPLTFGSIIFISESYGS